MSEVLSRLFEARETQTSSEFHAIVLFRFLNLKIVKIFDLQCVRERERERECKREAETVYNGE